MRRERKITPPPPTVFLTVAVPDYGAGYVDRVCKRLQEAADERWPAARIRVRKAE